MNLLILSASTGGGHDMRAYALRDWWHQRGGTAVIHHPLESSFIGYKFGCNLYNLIQRKLPLMHFGYFYFLEYASMHRGPKRIIGSKRFVRFCRSINPQIIVSVHSHLNHGFFELIKRDISKSISFAVFSGELADGIGFSRHWVNPFNDLFVGPTQECCIAAQKRGMPPEKCLMSGPLLRRSFFQKENLHQKQVLDELGLKKSVPTYLLSTGANGVNKHQIVIDSIMERGKYCQVIALCGKNKSTLATLNEKYRNLDKIKVIPLSTIDDKMLVRLLRAVDFVFARPGAGISTEVLVTGTHVVFDISGGVMPQEINNLNYWKKHSSFVPLCKNPRQLPVIVDNLRGTSPLSIKIDEQPRVLLSALESLVK